MRRLTNSHKNSTTNRKRRRLKKSIREAFKLTLIGMIGAVVLTAMFFGAAFQEQERLTVMAWEVQK